VEKLQYAFAKRKIEKQQEDLQRVQHMFMFMTTSLSFLPSQHVGGSGHAPTGHLRGTLEHVPIRVNIGSGAGGPTYYEATIELKPHPAPLAVLRVDERKREKIQLELMRRNPYFSEKLLEPRADNAGVGGRWDLPAGKIMHEKMRVEDVRVQSKERAAEEVHDLLSQVDTSHLESTCPC
jgi:hypothetical protein